MVPVGPVALLTKDDSRPATPWEKVAGPRESVPPAPETSAAVAATFTWRPDEAPTVEVRTWPVPVAAWPLIVPATLTPAYVPFRPKLVSPATVNLVLAPYTEDWIWKPLPLADAESWVMPAVLSAPLIKVRIVARSAPGGAVTVAVTPLDVTVNVFGGGEDG